MIPFPVCLREDALETPGPPAAATTATANRCNSDGQLGLDGHGMRLLNHVGNPWCRGTVLGVAKLSLVVGHNFI